MIKYNTFDELIQGIRTNGIQELEFASEELQRDAKTAIGIENIFNWYDFEDILKYIPENVKNREYILKLGENSADAIKYFDDREDIMSDRDFVLEYMKYNNPDTLMYVASDLKNDKNFILKCINNAKESGHKVHVIQYVSDQLIEDKNFVLECIRCGDYDHSIAYIPEKMRDDREIMVEYIKYSPALARFMGKQLKPDKIDILTTGIINGKHRQEAFDWSELGRLLNEKEIDEFKHNKEIIFALMNHSQIGYNFDLSKWASEDLLEDKGFILEAMKSLIIYGKQRDEVTANIKLENISKQYQVALASVTDSLQDTGELESNQTNKKQHTASEVAEIDCIKSSDIEQICNEIIESKGVKDKEDIII